MVVMRANVEAHPEVDLRAILHPDYTLMHYQCLSKHPFMTHWSVAGMYHGGESSPRVMDNWDSDCPKCGLPGELVQFGFRGGGIYSVVSPGYPVVLR